MQSRAILCALTLLGCPTVTPNVAGVTPIHVQGVYTHEPSGFVLPPSIGSFRRVAINQYDREGLDVSVGYNLDEVDAEVAFTLYVTPPLRLPDGSDSALSQQFEVEIGAIQHHHGGAPVLHRQNTSSEQAGTSATGLLAQFRFEEVFGSRQQVVESLLHLFEYDGWRVKYRTTFPLSQREAVAPQLERFLASLQWRGQAASGSPPVVPPSRVARSSSPPVVGRARLGDEPAVGIVVQLSFSQTNKDCVPSDPSTITDQSGSFRFARGVGEPLPARDRASGWADDAAARARAMIGGVWGLCFEGRGIERRSFSWPWIGDPALTYATMECDLASQEEKPCVGSWLGE